MATLTVINNPFNPTDKTVSKIDGGLAIFHYLNLQAEDIEYVVSLNGKITEDYTYILKQNDFLAVVPIPAGGSGGKNPLALVAMLALTVVTAGAAGVAMAGAFGITSTVGVAVFTAGVRIAGGLLINALLPASNPSTNTNSQPSEVSPTYSFSGSSNAKSAGTSLPIMLGSARVTPPIINSFLSLSGDKQYLNILCAVNDGTVDDISDIYLNNQAINNYTNVSYEIKKGSINQSACNNFRDSINTTSLQVTIDKKNGNTTYTTQGNIVQGFDVVVAFTKGLFSLDDSGNYANKELKFKIEYKKTKNSTWKSKTITVRDTFKTAKRISYSFENLSAGKYDIKLTRLSDYDESTKVANTLQLDYVNEIVYEDFTYPGVALLALKVQATDQLNGSFPTVSCKVKNNHKSTGKDRSNPAWACYNLLKRDGVEDKNIDLDSFSEWAEYCDDEGFTCNLYIDSQQELQSVLNIVSVLGRATVVQFGSVFAPVVEKVVDLPTQGFLFNTANIEENSFELSYIPFEDRSNVVEVTYYDEDDEYNAKTVQVQSDDFDSSTKEVKSSITLYGCTKRKIALRYAKFLLNKNRYISETVSFTASIDSIACKVGEVIKVGVKYMTNTLSDGRVVSATNNTITLDNTITLQAGVSYELQLRYADDTLECIDLPVLSKDSTSDTINISGLSQSAQRFDLYAIGLSKVNATNLYKVTSITRDSDLKRKIQAIEYNPTVYEDDVDVQLEEVVKISTQVTNLSADEMTLKYKDGSVRDVIVLNWEGGKIENSIYLDNYKVGTTSATSYVLEKDFIQGKIYQISVNNTSIAYTFKGSRTKPTSPQNLRAVNNNGVYTIKWDAITDIDLSHYEIKLNMTSPIADTNGAIFTLENTEEIFLSQNSWVSDAVKHNSYKLFELYQGTYNIEVVAVTTEGVKSSATKYSLTVDAPMVVEQIEDVRNDVKTVVLDTKSDISRIDTTIADESSARASSIKTLSTSITTVKSDLNGKIDNTQKTLTVNIQKVEEIAQTANGYSASASQLITDSNNNITGWRMANGSNVKSTFRIFADKFTVGSGNSAYQPFTIEDGNIYFNGKAKFTSIQNVPDYALSAAVSEAKTELTDSIKSTKDGLNNKINKLTKVEDIAWQKEVQKAIDDNATTIDGGKIITNKVLANSLLSKDITFAGTIKGGSKSGGGVISSYKGNMVIDLVAGSLYIK